MSPCRQQANSYSSFKAQLSNCLLEDAHPMPLQPQVPTAFSPGPWLVCELLDTPPLPPGASAWSTNMH